MKKYELTDETIDVRGAKLYRIKALRDIEAHGVKAGDLGGWVKFEQNLDQYCDAWVGDNARVSGGIISDDAYVGGDAKIYGGRIFNDAYVGGGIIYGGDICGHAQVSGGTIYDGIICGHAQVSGGTIYGGEIYDDAQVSGGKILGVIYGHAQVTGGTVHRNSRIACDVKIQRTGQVIVVGPIGSRDDHLTIIPDQNYAATGCFAGSIDKFLKKVGENHGDNLHGRMYKAAIELAMMGSKK